MFTCPIDYFTDNLIFARDKSCWAGYELQGFSYDLRSDRGKLAILDRITLFLAGIQSEAKILLIPTVQSIDQNMDALIAGLREEDPLAPAAQAQANATRTYLKDLDTARQRANDYKTFIFFKLDAADQEVFTRLKELLDFFVGAVVNDISALMSADVADIPQSRIRACLRSAELIELEENRRLRLRPIKPETTQWLLRRMAYRGTRHSFPTFRRRAGEGWTPDSKQMELAGKTYLRPRKKRLVNLFSGEIHTQGRILRIEHAECETSYQTLLAVTNLPEEQIFPGCEWIYQLQKENQNAELCIHIRAVEHRESLRKIELRRRGAGSQGDNIAQAGAQLPADLWESMESIETLEAELKANRLPLLQCSVVLCFAGTDPAELENQARQVRHQLEDRHFIVEQPLADQMNLYWQCMPGVGFTVSDFTQLLPPRALAAGIFGATRELGSRIGYYVGAAGPEWKHIFLDFRLACLSNKSAAAVFYGDLGYGKSFNANLLTYLHVLYGGYGLIIDPKGERTHWLEQLPALKDHIALVTLSPEPRYRGMLDPFNIFRDDLDEACTLALNLVAELFRLRPREPEYLAMQVALEQIKGEPNPSMTRVAELLETFDEDDELRRPAQLLARQLRLQRNSGMTQLLIGTGEEASIRLDQRLSILQIQNLRLPDASAKKEDYTQEETVSIVLMMVISAFCRRFVHSRPSRFKIILFDESWALGKTPEGEKLISYISRMSRSLYSSIVLNGHSVTDLPNEGVRNSITYKFCFHTDSTAEARRMLEFLKLEDTEENIGLLTGLGNRQCLFQDLDGRVGVLTFDAVFADLIDVFSTTPEDESAEKTALAGSGEGKSYA